MQSPRWLHSAAEGRQTPHLNRLLRGPPCRPVAPPSRSSLRCLPLRSLSPSRGPPRHSRPPLRPRPRPPRRRLNRGGQHSHWPTRPPARCVWGWPREDLLVCRMCVAHSCVLHHPCRLPDCWRGSTAAAPIAVLHSPCCPLSSDLVPPACRPLACSWACCCSECGWPRCSGPT